MYRGDLQNLRSKIESQGFELHSYAPGDGKRRYQIREKGSGWIILRAVGYAELERVWEVFIKGWDYAQRSIKND